MFAGSRFCARCGAEATRELLEDEKPLPCPRCRESMQALRLGDTVARECGACGGLWLDPLSLQRLCDGREVRAEVVSALGARVPSVRPLPDVVRYVPCPLCGRIMNRKNFAQSSGVVLDVCVNHGVWLDRGELERVLSFVSDGGLARARVHEQQQRAEERRRLAALQRSPLDRGMGAEIGTFAQHDATWGRNEPTVAQHALGRLLLDALHIVVSE